MATTTHRTGIAEAIAENPDTSFAARAFCGELHAERVSPFPRLDPAEATRVRELVERLESYCAAEYDPAEVERDAWVPDATLRALGEIGLLGLYVDPAYGGQGLSQTGYCKVFQAVGRIDATLAVVLGVHQSIGYKGIHLFGTDEQKQRFLPDLCAGRKLAAYALTEENAGSDAYHVESVADPRADGSYVLNGEKRYIGNGSRADVLTTFARTPSGEHVALLVESDMEGFEIGERFETMGLRGNDLRRLRFHDVVVPAGNVLGERGDGFRIAMEILNNGRMSLGAGAAGSVRLLLDEAVEHVTNRRQFGRRLCDFELVAAKIGQMATQLYGLESMAFLTTGMADAGATDVSLESAIVKVAGTEFLWYAANRTFQLVGGKAYMADEPYEKVLRDIRVFPIFEGANDVLRMMIALQGCKELGEELDELKHLDLRDPLRSLGAVVSYLGDRIRLVADPPTMEVAEGFGDAVERLGDQLGSLRTTTESLLRRHGESVSDHQAQLKRIAQVAIESYGQTATLSRITDLLDSRTESTALGEESSIARSFCQRSANRSDRWLAQSGSNDDDLVANIADATLSRGHYSHSI